MKHVALWAIAASAILAACAPQATAVPRPLPDATSGVRPIDAPTPEASLAAGTDQNDEVASNDVQAAVAQEPETDTAGAPALTDFLPRNAADLGRLERLAWEAWARMEVGRFLDGHYDTLALTELELPRGVRWTVLSLQGDAYVLSITSDEADVPWRVSEAGVEPVR